MTRRADGELLGAVRTIIRLARVAGQVCEEGGLTLAQYRALHSADRGDQRAYELAQYAAVSRPAISALTNGMVKSGLIERVSLAADGRGVLFSITDTGRRTLRSVEDELVARFKKVLGDSTAALAMLNDEALVAAIDIQADKDFGTSVAGRRARS
ncbi:MarR family winged helix-turn-helix transcriptional regulator [Amycolatopsis jejuensis]|uniref:MarR family winged helix-turn-helix transcriptional regulator n=1 Tax=Amycolatopsis jejuensis TaxID=330084 RepID=UPI000691B03F|nr:MarR family transcriptional regulator [Amycolatopsis jejuensis]